MDFNRICPTQNELMKMPIDRPCPHANCHKYFKSLLKLKLHIIKNHEVQELHKCPADIVFEYYCPVSDCIYNLNNTSRLFFKQMRLLKQHFQKIHLKQSKKTENITSTTTTFLLTKYSNEIKFNKCFASKKKLNKFIKHVNIVYNSSNSDELSKYNAKVKLKEDFNNLLSYSKSQNCVSSRKKNSENYNTHLENIILEHNYVKNVDLEQNYSFEESEKYNKDTFTQISLKKVTKPEIDTIVRLNVETQTNKNAQHSEADFTKGEIYKNSFKIECEKLHDFQNEQFLNTNQSNDCINTSDMETQTALDELLYCKIPQLDYSISESLFPDITISDIQTQTSWEELTNFNNSIQIDSKDFVLTSTETQTCVDLCGKNYFTINNHNPMYNFYNNCCFKETQTCDCFSRKDNNSHHKEIMSDNIITLPTHEYNLMTSSNLLENSEDSKLLNKKVCLSTSTETQTLFSQSDSKFLTRKQDVLLSYNSTQTQTMF